MRLSESPRALAVLPDTPRKYGMPCFASNVPRGRTRTVPASPAMSGASSPTRRSLSSARAPLVACDPRVSGLPLDETWNDDERRRSEEHTSELQSQSNLV